MGRKEERERERKAKTEKCKAILNNKRRYEVYQALKATDWLDLEGVSRKCLITEKAARGLLNELIQDGKVHKVDTRYMATEKHQLRLEL